MLDGQLNSTISLFTGKIKYNLGISGMNFPAFVVKEMLTTLQNNAFFYKCTSSFLCYFQQNDFAYCTETFFCSVT